MSSIVLLCLSSSQRAARPGNPSDTIYREKAKQGGEDGTWKKSFIYCMHKYTKGLRNHKRDHNTRVVLYGRLQGYTKGGLTVG